MPINADDICSSGRPATSRRSSHRKIPGLGEILVSNSAEAVKFVADGVMEGPDHIKVLKPQCGIDDLILQRCQKSTLYTLVIEWVTLA
jgi:hypothetical protein